MHALPGLVYTLMHRTLGVSRGASQHFSCWAALLYLCNTWLCVCRCRLSTSPKFRKLQSWHQRHFARSRCQPAVRAYAPSRTEAPHKQASGSSPIEEQLSAQHQCPAELLELRRQDSSLLLGGDTALLEGLARTTTVTPHAAGGVILGFSVANGAVASQDFPVGKVFEKPQQHHEANCAVTYYNIMQVREGCTNYNSLHLAHAR